MNVVSEKPVTLTEVSELLKKRQKEGELGYEQLSTLQYAEKFSKLTDLKEVSELKKELSSLGFFSEAQIVKLIDLLPMKEDDLRAIVSKDKTALSEEQAKEVIKILKKYKK